MIALLMAIVSISSIKCISSIQAGPVCHEKPCWMDWMDVGHKFLGEPIEREGGKEVYLARQETMDRTGIRYVLGKFVISDKTLVPIEGFFANFSSDLPLQILFSPPGTVGWVDSNYEAFHKAIPANALKLFSTKSSGGDCYLCRPKFPHAIDSRDVDADPGVVYSNRGICATVFGFCGKKNKRYGFFNYRILVNPLDDGKTGGPTEILRCPGSKVSGKKKGRIDERLRDLAAVIRGYRGPPINDESTDEKRFRITPNRIEMPGMNDRRPFFKFEGQSGWTIMDSNLQSRNFVQYKEACWINIDLVKGKLIGEGIGNHDQFLVRYGKSSGLRHFGKYVVPKAKIIPIGFAPDPKPGEYTELLYLPHGSFAEMPTSQQIVLGGSLPSKALLIDRFQGKDIFLCYPYLPRRTLEILKRDEKKVDSGIMDTSDGFCYVRLEFCQGRPRVVGFEQYHITLDRLQSGTSAIKNIRQCSDLPKLRSGGVENRWSYGPEDLEDYSREESSEFVADPRVSFPLNFPNRG